MRRPKRDMWEWNLVFPGLAQLLHSKKHKRTGIIFIVIGANMLLLFFITLVLSIKSHYPNKIYPLLFPYIFIMGWAIGHYELKVQHRTWMGLPKSKKSKTKSINTTVVLKD